MAEHIILRFIVFILAKKASDNVTGLCVYLQLALMGKERIKNVHCEFRSFNGLDFMDKLVR